MYTIDNLPESINIGKQGEGGILTLEFDCAAWLAKYPGGAITAVYIDPRTNAIAPIPLSQAYKTGSTFYIKVLHNLTVYAGYAYINIRLVDGSDIEKRTAMIKVYVEKGVTPSADMPGMVQDWVNDATSKLAEVDHFVDETIDATEAANAAALRAENGEDAREQAEGLRVIAEQGRHDAYGLAELARDGLYEAAEIARDELFESAETTRNTQSGEATDRANAIADTLEGIAPLWSDVDISVSALGEGAAPTASIAQGETGTSITLGIPKGDTGAQGPIGNVMYATFDIDFDTGELVMTIPDGYTGPTFSINDETGELEVSI